VSSEHGGSSEKQKMHCTTHAAHFRSIMYSLEPFPGYII